MILTPPASPGHNVSASLARRFPPRSPSSPAAHRPRHPHACLFASYRRPPHPRPLLHALCMRDSNNVVEPSSKYPLADIGGSFTIVRVDGPIVTVEHPPGSSDPLIDSGTVTSRSLILRRGGFDFVYERVSSNDDFFYLRTSDINQWMVGSASFSNEGSPTYGWAVLFAPTDFVRNQYVSFSRAAGRPAPGSYQVGPRGSAIFHAHTQRDLPSGGQVFESTGGTVTITESTMELVAGSFVTDLNDGHGSLTRIEGRFVARCSIPTGCA